MLPLLTLVQALYLTKNDDTEWEEHAGAYLRQTHDSPHLREDTLHHLHILDDDVSMWAEEDLDTPLWEEEELDTPLLGEERVED